MANSLFSQQLEIWLKGDQHKTLGNLTEVFGPKSFAVLMMILMLLPALPLPTGLISHVFEVLTMILAIEMVLGHQTIWLPRWAIKKQPGQVLEGMAMPFVIKRVRWLEKYSRPRLEYIMRHRQFGRLAGGLIFILALAAALAPPFTGLDTLPAMGVIAICLSIILEDMALLIVGIVLGAVGIGLEIGLGLILQKLVTHWL